jgi:transposase-like protein
MKLEQLKHLEPWAQIRALIYLTHHAGTRARKIRGTGGSGKVAVMGLLERHGEVRTMVVPNVRRKSLHGEVRKHVEYGATVSDSLRSYNRLQDEYTHNVINHAESYVNGRIHTNGIENFWSLLKVN